MEMATSGFHIGNSGEGAAHHDQATGEWQGHFGTRADAGDLDWFITSEVKVHKYLQGYNIIV